MMHLTNTLHWFVKTTILFLSLDKKVTWMQIIVKLTNPVLKFNSAFFYILYTHLWTVDILYYTILSYKFWYFGLNVYILVAFWWGKVGQLLPAMSPSWTVEYYLYIAKVRKSHCHWLISFTRDQTTNSIHTHHNKGSWIDNVLKACKIHYIAAVGSEKQRIFQSLTQAIYFKLVLRNACCYLVQ